VISVTDLDRKWGMLFLNRARFSVALLNSLADLETEIYFSREKYNHVNAPNEKAKIERSGGQILVMHSGRPLW